MKWDAIKAQSANSSPLDSSNVTTATNREVVKAYALMGQLRQELLNAARDYAMLWP